MQENPNEPGAAQGPDAAPEPAAPEPAAPEPAAPEPGAGPVPAAQGPDGAPLPDLPSPGRADQWTTPSDAKGRRWVVVGLALLGLAVVLAVVVVAVTREWRTGNPNDLRVGDCFDLLDPNASTIRSVPHHPCTQTHYFEVFFIATDTSPKGATYPGTNAFDKVVSDQCSPAFATYIGILFEDSTLEMGYLYPKDESWVQGDRTITCYVSLPTFTALTSSLKGSKR